LGGGRRTQESRKRLITDKLKILRKIRKGVLNNALQQQGREIKEEKRENLEDEVVGGLGVSRAWAERERRNSGQTKKVN